MLGNRTYLMLGITIAAVVFGGWRMLVPGADSGSSEVASEVSTLIGQATSASFTAAAASLDAQRTATGSFAGAPLTPPFTLVRADETSYCVQLVKGLVAQHLVGPGGTPQSGACP